MGKLCRNPGLCLKSERESVASVVHVHIYNKWRVHVAQLQAVLKLRHLPTSAQDLRWTIAFGGLLEDRHILDVQPCGRLSHNFLHGILPHLEMRKDQRGPESDAYCKLETSMKHP